MERREARRGEARPPPPSPSQERGGRRGRCDSRHAAYDLACGPRAISDMACSGSFLCVMTCADGRALACHAAGVAGGKTHPRLL